MGQIIGSAAKPKRCNKSQLSQLGTPAAGEHILVSSDNSMNAAGQGNFDAYIIGDNVHPATELTLHLIDGGAQKDVADLKTLLDVETSTTEESIIDYVPAGTAALTDSNFWANIGSKTTPDRDESGILSRIEVLSAPSADTAFSIRLYKKVWTDGEVTGFTLVANSERSFTMPSGQTSLDVSSENITIDTDVVIFISKLAKYNSLGTGYGALNGAFSPGFSAKMNLNVNYFISHKHVNSEVLDGIQSETDAIAADLDFRPMPVDKSIIDYTPSGTGALSGSGYWAAIKSKSMPDRATSGILKEIKFTSGNSTDTAISIKLYRKIWADGVITGFSEVTGSTHSYTMPANQLSLNVLSDNITIEPDVIVAIQGMAKYQRNGECYAIYNGAYNSGFDGFFEFNVDYIIQTTEETSARLAAIEAALPSADVFAGLQEANVVCMGDSITWLGGDDCNGRQNPSQGWTTYFKAMLKPKTMRSYARSGATWSHTANTTYNITENTGNLSDDNVIYNQINRLLADTAQPAPDIIIIAAGTNDGWYASQRPDAVSVSAAEEFADTSGYITSQAVNTLTSIAAAMRYDIEMLKTNFPNAQIFVTTPLQSTKFTLAKGFQIGTIIKECAECLSIECIDQGKQAGIYRAQEIVGYTFTYDGAHTSALGARMVGQFILKKVLCNYRNLIASTT